MAYQVTLVYSRKNTPAYLVTLVYSIKNAPQVVDLLNDAESDGVLDINVTKVYETNDKQGCDTDDGLL